MAPKKLSESEKKEIIQLYGNPEESTSTLASRFGVSSSTISRVLKQGLSDDDYNNLVQQKRTGSQPVQSSQPTPEQGLVSKTQDDTERLDASRSEQRRQLADTPKPKPKTKSSQARSQEPSEAGEKDLPSHKQADRELTHEMKTDTDRPLNETDSDREPLRRRRRRSSTTETTHMSNDDVMDDDVIQLPLTQLTDAPGIDDEESSVNQDEPEEGDRPYDTAVANTQSYSEDDEAFDEDDTDFAEALDEDLLDDEDDDFSDDLDDEDDDEDFSDGDELSEGDVLEPLHFSREDLVQIYPFSDAELPRTCYLVIDRSAELITRPLQEFGELGDLPSAELSENTLPVFDNHRVAKRFANRRTQRIVKIPDSRILRKTTPYLQSKGITRLLIDGQVYSLTD